MIGWGVTSADVAAAAGAIAEHRTRREIAETLREVKATAAAQVRRDRLTAELDDVTGRIEARRTAGDFGSTRADAALLDKLRRLRAERGF